MGVKFDVNLQKKCVAAKKSQWNDDVKSIDNMLLEGV